MTSYLVTGGTKGVGREVALRLAARDGAHLLLGYHSDESAASSCAGELIALGATVTLVRADLSKPSGAERLVDATRSVVSPGDLGGIVHCAVDVSVRGPVLDMARDDIVTALQCNALSLLTIVQGSLPLLAAGSSVCFLSSAGAEKVIPGYGAIGTSKALGEALVRYLAVELAPRDIRVNTLCAGAMDTEAIRSLYPDGAAARMLEGAGRRSPSGRGLELREVADVVEHLLSTGSAMIRGQRIVVDGGSSLV
jgi:NAD(P)-dependent dehydrogenase (short-subunit alcohol dehydrogenase family)